MQNLAVWCTLEYIGEQFLTKRSFIFTLCSIFKLQFLTKSSLISTWCSIFSIFVVFSPDVVWVVPQLSHLISYLTQGNFYFETGYIHRPHRYKKKREKLWHPWILVPRKTWQNIKNWGGPQSWYISKIDMGEIPEIYENCGTCSYDLNSHYLKSWGRQD